MFNKGTLNPHWVSFTVFTAKIQTQAWKPILRNNTNVHCTISARVKLYFSFSKFNNGKSRDGRW